MKNLQWRKRNRSSVNHSDRRRHARCTALTTKNITHDRTISSAFVRCSELGRVLLTIGCWYAAPKKTEEPVKRLGRIRFEMWNRFWSVNTTVDETLLFYTLSTDWSRLSSIYSLKKGEGCFLRSQEMFFSHLISLVSWRRSRVVFSRNFWSRIIWSAVKVPFATSSRTVPLIDLIASSSFRCVEVLLSWNTLFVTSIDQKRRSISTGGW